ncbi:RNA polymerase sigma factor [Parapedobacter deserti]|uniref:RNA polymerase sigma factor n=1 Tax=Parapedobacter deserti TaxID=1912957 RepID=UPI00366ED7AF
METDKSRDDHAGHRHQAERGIDFPVVAEDGIGIDGLDGAGAHEHPEADKQDHPDAHVGSFEQPEGHVGPFKARLSSEYKPPTEFSLHLLHLFLVDMADYGRYTDHRLLSLLKSGDERAFAEIYQRYWEVLFRHALRILQDDDLAKDALQDVFATLWDKHATIDDRGRLSAFLYRSVRNRVFDLLDHSKVKNAYLSMVTKVADEGVWSVDAHIREKELAKAIEREVANMPEGMRRVFELNRRDGLSYREIASELHISENTVKVQVSRALRLLRKVFNLLISALVCILTIG